MHDDDMVYNALLPLSQLEFKKTATCQQANQHLSTAEWKELLQPTVNASVCLFYSIIQVIVFFTELSRVTYKKASQHTRKLIISIYFCPVIENVKY